MNSNEPSWRQKYQAVHDELQALAYRHSSVMAENQYTIKGLEEEIEVLKRRIKLLKIYRRIDLASFLILAGLIYLFKLWYNPS